MSLADDDVAGLIWNVEALVGVEHPLLNYMKPHTQESRKR